jgi:putative ATP-dependent endonuclease of OLD family
MKPTRTHISNFHNFQEFDVALDGDVVIVGENGVGKSDLRWRCAPSSIPACPTTRGSWTRVTSGTGWASQSRTVCHGGKGRDAPAIVHGPPRRAVARSGKRSWPARNERFALTSAAP